MSKKNSTSTDQSIEIDLSQMNDHKVRGDWESLLFKHLDKFTTSDDMVGLTVYFSTDPTWSWAHLIQFGHAHLPPHKWDAWDCVMSTCVSERDSKYSWNIRK